MVQGGAEDYGSHLPIPMAMSNSKSEYTVSAVACMKACHLRMMGYDLENMKKHDHDPKNMKCLPAYIIIDNKDDKSMTECNKDTPENRNVARRCHYVRQETLLN